MTSLFVTIVAIVLFGVISLLSITYIDMDNARATTQAPVVAAAMGNMIEAAAIYRAANEVAPTSVAVLEGVVDAPAVPNLGNPQPTWMINNNRACLVVPTSSVNTDLLNAAAFRLSTASGGATVSTTCGSQALTGQTALSVGI